MISDNNNDCVVYFLCWYNYSCLVTVTFSKQNPNYYHYIIEMVSNVLNYMNRMYSLNKQQCFSHYLHKRHAIMHMSHV